jgi:hypothetical protein
MSHPLQREARLAFVFVLMLGACSGSITCGGCSRTGLDPLPTPFPGDARIDRAAEIRVTRRGLDFVGSEFASLVSAYGRMDCGVDQPVPCPTGFRVGGMNRATTCDAAEEICVDPTTRSAEPVLGFELERATQSGATICRDDVNDPNRRDCFAWLRLEGLQLRPSAPNRIEATVTAQIYTTNIPIRYDSLGMDCIVTLNSNASGSGQQDFVLTAELLEWRPPPGAEGRQLEVSVIDASAMIPDGDLTIARDPVHGGTDDVFSCGLANAGPVKSFLVRQIMNSLTDIMDAEVRSAIGWRCNQPNTDPCPSGTTCNAEYRCEDSSGVIVPQKLGTDGRLDFAVFLGNTARSSVGSADVSFLVGGPSSADVEGISIGTLGGMEVFERDATCAPSLASPRLRPGYMAPISFPIDSMVDLDFDGTPESSYMVGAGVSQQVVDQVVWSAHQAGLFCASVDSETSGLINTGSLSVLMPSLQQLTHADRYSWSVWPARIGIRPGEEPRMIIGEGRTSGMLPDLMLDSPLLRILLPSLEIRFSALIEERWVHLMTITADVEIPVGVYSDPSGEIRVLVGDLENSISNVRAIDHEILAETSAELEDAVPALISLALPQITDRLLVPFTLPTAADLGGFELSLLGVRGVPNGMGAYSHIGLYLDLGFDPSQAGNLSLSAETEVAIERFWLPSSEEMAVTHAGGPVRPEVELRLSGHAPSGSALEHQIRIDGGPWSPFVRTERLVLRRPELLVQGRHQIEVRARIAGDAKSLDPTPSRLEVVVDSEPPSLRVRLAPSASGAHVSAFDVVSRDRVQLELVAGETKRVLEPDETGFVFIPELEQDLDLSVRASDEVGLHADVVLRSASGLAAAPTAEPKAGGCTCARPKRQALSSLVVLALVAGWISFRRRR